MRLIDTLTVKNELGDTPERLCCFAPRQTNNSSNNADVTSLVAAFESGFAFYTPEKDQLKWIARLETDNPGTRFNDGGTDRQGRFWAATMVESEKLARYKGSLYCLNHDLTVTKTIGRLSIPNSLCWSPDGKTMYHTDTPSMQIKQYNYDIASGFFDNRTAFVTTNKACYPDGSTIDAQGYLWNAQWGSNRVVRYSLCL